MIMIVLSIFVLGLFFFYIHPYAIDKESWIVERHTLYHSHIFTISKEQKIKQLEEGIRRARQDIEDMEAELEYIKENEEGDSDE